MKNFLGDTFVIEKGGIRRSGEQSRIITRIVAYMYIFWLFLRLLLRRLPVGADVAFYACTIVLCLTVAVNIAVIVIRMVRWKEFDWMLVLALILLCSMLYDEIYDYMN